MAYNKAKAEYIWRKQKDQEERKLRALGVDEDTIQQLHNYDWDMFKAERNYKSWNILILCRKLRRKRRMSRPIA